MFVNHLKIAWRVFTKRKLYGIINLVGLSVGLGFALLVVLYVRDEFKYDKHHANADRLFLIHSQSFKNEDLNTQPGFFDTERLDNVVKSTVQGLEFADLVEGQVPEIEQLIRVEWNSTVIEKGGKLQREEVRYVDENFFEAFTHEFLMGNPESALSEIDNVVITDEIAMTYFGKIDVVGEMLQLGGNEGRYQRVSGVIRKKKNSVMDVNLIMRNEQSRLYRAYKDGSEPYRGTTLFALIPESSSKEVVAQKITDLYASTKKDEIEGYKLRLKLSESNPGITYDLVNIQDIYLDPTIRYGRGSAKLYSYILISIAVIIIVIACLNYVAIAISLAGVRSTEIALRKVMGSSKAIINQQFYTEAFFTAFIAALMGYSLMQLSLPLFNELAGKTLSMSVRDHAFALSSALALAMIISVLAGSVPARVMSALNVVSSIKSHATARINPGMIKAMVVFQFTLCIFFTGMGLTMKKQFDYIGEKDLGFDQEQLVYISAWGLSDKLTTALAKEPSIVQSSGLYGLFGFGGGTGRMAVQGQEYIVNRVQVDHGYLETLGLELVRGRNFDPDRNRELEQKQIVVNESMYKLLNADSVHSEWLNRVIGVVKDFNYQSLAKDIGPVQFSLSSPEYIGMVYARLQPGKTKEGLAAINKAYDELDPNGTARANFLDQHLANQYDDFHRWGRVINLAAILTVIIAATGLFGLTAINVMNRMKEMGIRKVLGAELSHLLILLNKQTLWLVFAAMAVAFPLWYYFSNTWVEGFAYHTSLGFGLFLGATVLCLIIVLLTMAFHGVKTSKINPIQLLRAE